MLFIQTEFCVHTGVHYFKNFRTISYLLEVNIAGKFLDISFLVPAI